MNIKVLGSGCANCKKLESIAKNAVKELGLDTNVDYITDMAKIMEYGVMRTPALVIDEKVVLQGRIPNVKEMKEIIEQGKTTENSNNGTCSCGGNC